LRFLSTVGVVTISIADTIRVEAAPVVGAIAATAATFKAEVAAVVAGVGRFAAATIVVVLNGKATSAFPDKSI
jgi:hypothetical protein